ncbi:MAG: type II toxin-antitoxin system VapC family toxin [Treponema sp.]|jgi:predicted nucleic acid-binding protein|nr:type II toxin-antitoxin system VapC family toxin [Treponema sp.]
MTSVLDCSFCAALFLSHDKSGEVLRIFRTFDDSAEVLVPVCFWDEMTGLLSAALARGRLKHSDVLEIIRLLELYHFGTDVSFGADHTGRILDLSQLYNLRPPVAVYLELAVRKNAALGTLNGALRAACVKAGVELLRDSKAG